MASETEQIIPSAPLIILTHDEQIAIWKLDQYWGEAGSYKADPYTGIRTLNKD
jgi:hypothetical protein